jgi:hypothetical protein
MTEKQIMDLIVYAEVFTNEPGMFATLANIQELPINNKGRLNVDQLLGIAPAPGQENAKPFDTEMFNKSRTEVIAHYRKMGLAPQEINKILRDIASKEYTKERATVLDDGRIDMHGSDGHAMSNSDYVKAKRDGKILSYEESQHQALSTSKDALAEVIARDKERYGTEKHIPKTKRELKKLSKDLGSLFAEINRQTVDLK